MFLEDSNEYGTGFNTIKIYIKKNLSCWNTNEKIKIMDDFWFFSDSLILNFFKRRQISLLNKDLAEIQRGVRTLQREYPYLLAHSNLHISNTTWDYIFDLWLDNAVVDFMIYKNVQDISKHLDALKSVVVRLIKQQLN